MTKAQNSIGEPQAPQLRRVLTTPLLTLYGLGVTIGAGIYVLVGVTAGVAGIYAPVSFLVAAIVVLFVALSYAELAVRMPVSAGEAAYVRAGFRSPTLAVIVGLLVAATGIVSAAAVAIGTAGYLREFIDLPTAVLTGLIIILLGLVAAKGIMESVTAAAIVTLIEIGGLGFAIYKGISVNPDIAHQLPRLVPGLELTAWTGIFAAGLLAFFAFIGFEDMVNVAEEVERPARTIPRSILLTLLIATVLYIAVVSIVVLTVPMDRLAGSEASLSLLFGPDDTAAATLFTGIAVLATMNGVLIQIIMASRVLYGLAAQQALPQWLGRIGSRTRTPINATALVVALVLALALIFPIGGLAETTSRIVLTTFILVTVSLVAIKIREARANGQSSVAEPGFTVPIWVPIFGALASFCLLLAGFL